MTQIEWIKRFDDEYWNSFESHLRPDELEFTHAFISSLLTEVIADIEKWKGDPRIGMRGDLYEELANKLKKKYGIES